MTKVDCLKRLYGNITGNTANGETVCDLLHQLGDFFASDCGAKFIVNVTVGTQEQGYIADKTNAQIYAAHQKGKVIEIHYGLCTLVPSMVTETMCYCAYDIMSTSTTAQRTVVNINNNSVGISTINYSLDVIS